MTRTNDITSNHLRPDAADLDRLLAGEHHDPHSILGAHEYGDHTVIRVLRPMRHEVVARDRRASASRSATSRIAAVRGRRAVHRPDRLPTRGRLPGRRLPRRAHGRRPVPLPAHARRDRPAPVRRGPSRAAVGGARRAPAHLHHARRRRRRRLVRGVGAECQGRQPDRRVQPLGRQRGAAARRSAPPASGSCSGPASPPTACTSSACTAPTAWSPTGPTRWRSPPRFRRSGRRGSRRATTRGATTTG